MSDFRCRLLTQGISIEKVILSNVTRSRHQHRRESYPLKSLCPLLPCGRAPRRTLTQICSKGSDKGYAEEPANDWLDTIEAVDRCVWHHSNDGEKHASSKFREAEHSFYAAFHIEKHVSITKQIARWRRDFATLRGREPTYEDEPEKIRRLERALVSLGQRCVPVSTISFLVLF